MNSSSSPLPVSPLLLFCSRSNPSLVSSATLNFFLLFFFLLLLFFFFFSFSSFFFSFFFFFFFFFFSLTAGEVVGRGQRGAVGGGGVADSVPGHYAVYGPGPYVCEHGLRQGHAALRVHVNQEKREKNVCVCEREREREREKQVYIIYKSYILPLRSSVIVVVQSLSVVSLLIFIVSCI